MELLPYIHLLGSSVLNVSTIEEAQVQITETTRFPPVGYCIYCGSTDDLRDEHVVPLALDGTLILPDSSCKACADMTSRLDLEVLRGFMLAARTVAGFATRRPKNRPTRFELDAEIQGTMQTRWLRAKDFPALLLLFVDLLIGFLVHTLFFFILVGLVLISHDASSSLRLLIIHRLIFHKLLVL